MIIVAKFTLGTIRSYKYGDAGELDETNLSILKNLAKDLGIDSKKKKKRRSNLRQLANSTNADALSPVVEISISSDPTITQFKENLPPFNKASYQLLGPSKM